ncbi:MAG: outer membrane protein transport protein [Candidatus Hydrogenedentes bacterium]|nr:outer membrane protein transport protein [Candidatus Hydrogenedentota bacterium]
MCLSLSMLSSAQELEVSISPSPVGSGARAAGMADAFVAIADDATASSWNPAGLVQLEKPELSVVASYNGIFEDFEAAFHPEVDSKHDDHNFDINYLSFVYPLPVLVLGRNASVALNYQRKYDFSRKFRLKYNTAAGVGGGLNQLLTFDFDQDGGLSTITPAFAIELTNRLSVGASVNLWYSSFLSDNGWEQKQHQRSMSFLGPSVFLTTTRAKDEYRDFKGENVTLGLMWNVTDKWSLGARYDSAFTAEADYKQVKATIRNNVILPKPTLTVAPTIIKEERKIRFPESFALGVAHRFSDRFTLSMDATRTDWNDFYFKTKAGKRFSLVNAAFLDDPLKRVHFDPTFTVRLGAEYIFIPKQPDEELKDLWTLRGGLFYDQEPASGHPDDFFGLALGLGYLTHQRVNIDLAYQLRFGNDVNSDFIRGLKGYKEDVYQHRVLLSTVVYFGVGKLGQREGD